MLQIDVLLNIHCFQRYLLKKIIRFFGIFNFQKLICPNLGISYDLLVNFKIKKTFEDKYKMNKRRFPQVNLKFKKRLTY